MPSGRAHHRVLLGAFPRRLHRGGLGVAGFYPPPPAAVSESSALGVESRARAADAARHEVLALLRDLVEEREKLLVVRAYVVMAELVEHDEDDVLVVEPLAITLAQLEPDALALVPVVAVPVLHAVGHLEQGPHAPPALSHDGLHLPRGALQHLASLGVVRPALRLDLPHLARVRARRGRGETRRHRAPPGARRVLSTTRGAHIEFDRGVDPYAEAGHRSIGYIVIRLGFKRTQSCFGARAKGVRPAELHRKDAGHRACEP